MGGGGFMHDAASASKKDRAQRQSRREKFNGNYSEQSILTGNKREKLEFPELPEEQVEQERKRIQEMFEMRNFRQKIVWSLLLVLAIVVIVVLYVVTQGFEHW